MDKKTIRDVDLAGKRVLVRVDFNVPIEDGRVGDDTRMTAAVPTILAIHDQKPRGVILMSHLCSPKSEPDPKYSMSPTDVLHKKRLGTDVLFVDETVGAKAEDAVAKAHD